jgi:hypothetical protein
MAVDWTKHWTAGDDGSLLYGRDIRTLQDDLDAVMLTVPITDADLAQITTALKVHASSLTGFVIYENEIICWENDLVYTT